jgi:hypothetical protein
MKEQIQQIPHSINPHSVEQPPERTCVTSKQFNHLQEINLEIEYARRSLVQLLLMLPGQNAGDGKMAKSDLIMPTSIMLYCDTY